MVETEIHCHECNKYFKVDFDTDKNGNHVVRCPNCNHEHCRVINDGKVTSARWDRRNKTHRYNGYGVSSTARYNVWATSGISSTDSYAGSWVNYRSI